MPAPLYLTKGELRAKLLTRMGYGGLGAGAGMFVPIADDLLEEAQEQLFQIFTDEKGVREWEIPTGVSQRWYDIPLTCDIDRIMGMYAQQNGDYWHPLIRGIGPEHDSDYEDTEDYPYRYDIRANEPEIGLYNQVQNGDFSIVDHTLGGIQGWTWGLSSFYIGGDHLVCGNPAAAGIPASSDTDAVIGSTYDIQYTIISGDVNLVTFGGVSVADNGLALSTDVGTHSYTVTAATTGGLAFTQNPSGVGLRVDNAIVEATGARSIRTQIEVWPKPDDVYLMKIEGPMVLGPFVADADRASFDSRLILLYAVAYGKAHLNRPDAKSAMDAWTLRLNNIKANQHGTREYVRRNPSRPEIEIRSRPKVI